MNVRGVAVAATLALACGGCKDKQSAAPKPAPRPAPVAPAEPERPALPETPPIASGFERPLDKPITIDEARAILPPIDGKEILPLKLTSNEKQVHGTWCIDGDGADDVARKVGRAMATATFTGLGIRGDARKAGVQGDRDGFRVSMVVSASNAATCPAPKHYFASATIFKP